MIERSTVDRYYKSMKRLPCLLEENGTDVAEIVGIEHMLLCTVSQCFEAVFMLLMPRNFILSLSSLIFYFLSCC